MEPELKLHLNETGKYRSEYLTFALQNLNKLDSYKDLIFNNINKNILSRVEKLQNLKSRINRIRAILPKLNECNNAMTIKSKKYYPLSKHSYYKYLNLEERPEEITNLINSNYNCNNQNVQIANVKKPLVEKPDNNILGKIPRESLDDCIASQLLSNMQKKVKDLASELYELRIRNMGSSLVNDLNDLVYEKTNYLETSFDFMNKKLIQKADLLWKIEKSEIDMRQNIDYNQLKKEEEDVPASVKKSTKKLRSKLQEAPKSITSKVKIEKYVNKKVLLEKPKEKQEFNVPISINLGGVVELNDEINEEVPTSNIDENIYPEREDLDFDFENQNDINNLNFDDDFDLPVDIITRKNLENMKNEENMNINTPTPNYSYQTANTSNINNTANNININVTNNKYNNNYSNSYNNNNNNVPQVSSSVSTGNIVVVSGGGPGVPPPPPPPPPPPDVPVIKTVPKKPAKAEEEGGNQIIEEPKKELSMAEQLATIKLKKVGTVKAKEVNPKKPPVVNHFDLLRQQIMIRNQRLNQHEEKNEEDEEEDEF